MALFNVFFSIFFAIFTVFGAVDPADAPAAVTSVTLDCPAQIQMDITDTRSIPLILSGSSAALEGLELYADGDQILTLKDVTVNDDCMTIVIAPTGEGTTDLFVANDNVESNHIQITVVDSARIAAEEAAKKQEQQQQEQAQAHSTVWIPKSGKRYHYVKDCSGMKNPTQVSIKEAIRRGYTPCKDCVG